VAHRWIFINSNGFGFFRECSGVAMRMISTSKRADFRRKTADFWRESDA
jgi:hypothetical protein